ncbi:MAG: TetR/AcrR family transcriptional regulator [Pseudomonas sp.]|uniref:TetR/AcrR family transcriptional regulator n=1 Tax=Pseudomonas sp. TaxID=306 RepID=UPI0011F8CD43|nr:TetR/AcrR family transcriptional regulator [Pseudomonas sp.]RZI76856.1 MAG: TetR/AcrR family transcriptional regulator [Pseudomonas sp.]
MATRTVGRPRSFDEADALGRAVDLFWKQGYAATSLDDLLTAMGIARSSFYVTFGSKQKVLWAVLALYTNQLIDRMHSAAASQPTPRRALTAVLEVAGCSIKPSQGCLFINIATELVPTDLEVRRIAREHLHKVDRLLTSLLRQHGMSSERASAVSGALMALTSGMVSLRKAGTPEVRVRAMLKMADEMLD